MNSLSSKQLLAGVRVFASYEALDREPGSGRVRGIRREFDELCQRALDLKLATSVVFTDAGCPDELLGRAERIASRPHWYPANSPLRHRADLLRISAANVDRRWLTLRLLAEPPSRKGTFWDNDPSLVFEGAARFTLCRSACIGHEGHVFFFCYPKERDWEELLQRAPIKEIGQGEHAYRELIPEPGKISG